MSKDEFKRIVMSEGFDEDEVGLFWKALEEIGLPLKEIPLRATCRLFKDSPLHKEVQRINRLH